MTNRDQKAQVSRLSRGVSSQLRSGPPGHLLLFDLGALLSRQHFAVRLTNLRRHQRCGIGVFVKTNDLNDCNWTGTRIRIRKCWKYKEKRDFGIYDKKSPKNLFAKLCYYYISILFHRRGKTGSLRGKNSSVRQGLTLMRSACMSVTACSITFSGSSSCCTAQPRAASCRRLRL